MGTDRPVALCRHSRLVASVGREGKTIRLWQSSTGRKVREWKVAAKVSSGDRSLVFSPDGRHLVMAGEDAMIRVYETATGKANRSWKGRLQHDDSGEPNHEVIDSLVFGPDGQSLASVDRNLVLRLWDWRTGRELHHFDGVFGPVTFSADGKVVAAGGADSRIRLWDAATGRDLSPFTDPGAVRRVAFSADGRLLVVAFDRGMLRLLDAASGQELKRLRGYSLLAISPDGRGLLVLRHKGDRLGPLCLLDAATGEEQAQFRDTNADDYLGGWRPDGKLLVTISTRRNMPVRVWDAVTGKERRKVWGQREIFHAECSPTAGSSPWQTRETRASCLSSQRRGRNCVA
jgi:WD40 repeat protein